MIQGYTVRPASIYENSDLAPEAACPIGYGFWQGDGLKTVAEVEEAFGMVAHRCDQLTGQYGAIRWFLNHVDEHPDRVALFRELAAEVAMEIAERKERVA